MSILEIIFVISCSCTMPFFFRLYNQEDFEYKNWTLSVILTQTIIGTLSDSYNLYYKNRLGKVLVIMDRFHVICLSFPTISIISYANNLHFSPNSFILAILFWFNGNIIYNNNCNNNKSLQKLQLWNHILWHIFMGIGTFKSLDNFKNNISH